MKAALQRRPTTQAYGAPHAGLAFRPRALEPRQALSARHEGQSGLGHDFSKLAVRPPLSQAVGPRARPLQLWRDEEVDGERDIEMGRVPDELVALGFEQRRVWRGGEQETCCCGLFDGDFVVFYSTDRLRQYEVGEEGLRVYTATRGGGWEGIQNAGGMDPDFGVEPEPQTAGEYNSRGFNYFSLTDGIARNYGKFNLGPPWVLLETVLPEGTIVEADPEIQFNGIRTMARVDAGEFGVLKEVLQ